MAACSKFGKNITHLCWTNQRTANSQKANENDPYEWNWRIYDINIDLVRFAYWFKIALYKVDPDL